MREILTSIRRTPYQSLAAFLVLFFTLLLSAILFLSMNFLNGLLGYVETRPQVTVYFQTKTSESDIAKMKNDLLQSDKIETIKYISKDEAFKTYKQLNGDNPLLLEMVSADILPASLEIYAKKPEYLPHIAELLKKQPGIDEVVFQKDIFERLLTLTNVLRKTAMVLFAFLILMSIIVLSTTTSFKIALKKEEIELQRLIGASKGYIRGPFIGEGIFFGIVAALTSFIVITGVVFGLRPFLQSYFRSIPHLAVNYGFGELPVWPVNIYLLGFTLLFIALFGIGIGIAASYIATRKYLSQF